MTDRSLDGTYLGTLADFAPEAPYYQTPDRKVALHHGHVLDVLREMPAESVNCCVTSPPYWSLRKYDCEPVIWGGDSACAHEWCGVAKNGAVEAYAGAGRWQHGGHSRDDTPGDWTRLTQGSLTCRLCGGWRGQYGLEPTPELYVEHTMMWMREVKRVLRPDGCLWLNLGDGYASGKGTCYNPGGGAESWETPRKEAGLAYPLDRGSAVTLRQSNLKPKDAVLMPFRVALAAQADGWWVRSVIIWAKPNPMPESVRDRPTDAHEYIFLLTKSKTYWYDADAVREPQALTEDGRLSAGTSERTNPKWAGGDHDRSGPQRVLPNGRNCRSVWTFPTQGFPDAHFAVFPRELPERCIKAGCPEWVCPKCGKARVRVTEKTEEVDQSAKGSYFDRGKTGERDGGDRTQPGERHINAAVGWTDCGCGEPFVGGVTLDPFAGSGTTCEVAYHLGRTAIGIDASAKYLDMAIERVKQGALL